VTTFGPYPATVISIHDGDTTTLDIDLGFSITLRYNCRAYGINAPELNTQAGIDARTYAQTLMPSSTRVIVLSHGWDKYGGRFDGTITLPDGTDWATNMLQTGHATPMKVT
jgi:endonuclease YncB( thermonuclease family)